MANRQFTQFRYSMEKQVVDLYAYVDIGAAGAPTLNKGKSKGVKSIARNSAGDYTVTLQDSYYRLLGFHCHFVSTSGPAAPTACVKVDTVTAVPGTIEFLTQSGGINTDPGNGEVMKLHITLSNSGAL